MESRLPFEVLICRRPEVFPAISHWLIACNGKGCAQAASLAFWRGFQAQVRGPTDVRFGSEADMARPIRDVRFTPESGHSVQSFGCPLSANSGYALARRSPATVTQSRQASRGEAPLSTGRLSEYPTDHYVGICIETSAMAEQNTLRLPRVNFSDCRRRLLPLEE